MVGTTFPAFIRAEYVNDGRAFDQFVSDIGGAGKRAQTAMQQALSGVRDTVAQALSVPRNAFGSLDVGVGELRKMEAQLEATAQASRQLQSALIAEARSTDGNTQSKIAAIRAANKYARANEEELESLRQSIAFNERLQAELNKTAAAHQNVYGAAARGTTAYQANTQSVRAMRQATTQAGQQLQDIVISMGSGQRASTVLAQQLPQLAFAFSDVGGKVGSVARVLAGPWGVGVALAAFALGPLIDGLFKTEKQTEKTGSATDQLINRLDLSKNSYSSLIEVVREYNKTQQKTEALSYAAAVAAKQLAIDNATLARSNLALLASAPVIVTPGGTASGELANNQQIAVVTKLIEKLEQDLRDASKAVDDYQVKARLDPVVAAQQAADNEIRILEEKQKKGLRIEGGYADARFKILKDLEAKQKALSEAGKKGGDLGPSLRDAVGSKLLSTAQQFSGLSENNRSNNSTLQAFFREAGINVDPKITRWCAAFVNAVLASNGIKGNGQLTASSFKSYGTAVDRPQTGDIVVLKPGTANGTTGHVGFYAGKGKNGGVLVTSGNDSHKVTTREYSQNRVSSYRRVPNADQQDAVARAEEAAAAAKQRALEKFANQLQQIDQINARITGEFDEQPKLLDRMTIASTVLKSKIEDIDIAVKDTTLTEEQRNELLTRRQSLLSTEALVLDAANKSVRDMVEESEKQGAIDGLRLQGRELEALVLERIFQQQSKIGPLTEAQAADVAETVRQEKLRAIALERVNEIQQRNLDIVSQTKDNTRATIRELLDGKGFKAIGNFFERAFGTYLDGLADQLTDQLFGDAFQKQKLKLLGLDKLDLDMGALAAKTNSTAQALDKLEKAALSASGAIGGPAANDNSVIGAAASTVEKVLARTQSGGIIVEGGRAPQSIQKTFQDTFTKMAERIFGPEFAGKLGEAVGAGMESYAFGRLAGGAFGKTGGKIGGALGGLLGAGSSLFGSSSGIGSLLGTVSAALPQVAAVLQVSSAVSGLLGNNQRKGGKTIGVIAPFLTAAFASSLRGSATIGSVNGALGVTGTRGNSSSRRTSATNSANSIIDQLTAVAEQLGVSIDASRGSASVGIRKKNYVFDPTGQGRTKGKGVIKLGKGEEAAAEAARLTMLDLIKDGVLVGLSQGAQALLNKAKDIESGLNKALKFQSVFDRLKEIDDPIGSALDKLDKEFMDLRNIFAEAGASAADYAQLQRLYEMERADAIEQANSRVTESLKSLYQELTIGNDARSLTERRQFAVAAYDPLAARVAAGDRTAYDAYADAARSLLDIERQIFGSQSGYFDRLNEVTSLTRTRIDAESNVSSTDRLGLTFTTALESQTTALISGIVGGLAPVLNAINSNVGGITGSNDNGPSGTFSGISGTYF